MHKLIKHLKHCLSNFLCGVTHHIPVRIYIQLHQVHNLLSVSHFSISENEELGKRETTCVTWEHTFSMEYVLYGRSFA